MTDETAKDMNEDAPNRFIIDKTLGEYGLDAEQIAKVKELGAETVEDLNSLVESDLTGIGIPVLKARKIVTDLKPTVEMPMDASLSFDTILPQVPDDESWLSALRADGTLKVAQSTVISAIRAALADRFGLYTIPKKLVAAIEDYVDVTEEQVTQDFWAIRKQLTRKSYGDLFAAIDGFDSSYVTNARKDKLLANISENLWPAIIGFNDALVNWQESWMQGAANPNMMIAAVMANSGNGVGLPPGIMQPPDCGVLRDAAESVNNALNRTFRGTGVQIAAALAYEAKEIKTMLENPRMPSMCGVPSRELLLKRIGVAVPATYPRMEQNLTKFVLGIMRVDQIAAGNEELQYFSTLHMLGAQIPWGDLHFPKSARPAGIGGTSTTDADSLLSPKRQAKSVRSEWAKS